MSLMLLLVSFFLLCSVTTLLYIVYPTWKLRRVPATPSLWGIGHLPLLLKHHSQVFINLAKELGPIFRFQMGRQPVVFVATTELCKELGVRKFKSANFRSIPANVEPHTLLLGGLFWTSDYGTWSSMRNVMSAMFHPEQLSNYVPIMQRGLSRACDILQKKKEDEDVNFTELLHALALDIVGETVFGTKLASLGSEASDHSELLRALNVLHKSFNSSEAPTSAAIGLFFPILQRPCRELLQRIPGTSDWRHHRNSAYVWKTAEKLLKERLELEGDCSSSKDVISHMIRARRRSPEMKELLTDKRIITLAYELILAGTDTTAVTLGNALYHISSYPEVEKKLLQEIDELAPLSDRLELTTEELEKFTYLDQVMNESMRLSFVSPVVAREASQDIELEGYRFSKGTWIWMSLISPAQDSQNFPEPDAFRPERFNPESEESRNRDPYACCPFGLGPRMCIGRKFAKLEIQIALIHLYQRFTFRHSPLMEKPLAYELGIVSTPKFGIRLRVEPRRRNS